jgi:hypothetical protein
MTHLFQINHVLLSQQAISTILYHVIIMLRSIQILFNIFYTINIEDEFNLAPTFTNIPGGVVSVGSGQ